MVNSPIKSIDSCLSEMNPIEDKGQYIEDKIQDRLDQLVVAQSDKLDNLLNELLEIPIDFDNLGRINRVIKSVSKTINRDMQGVMDLYALSNLYSQDDSVIYEKVRHLFGK